MSYYLYLISYHGRQLPLQILKMLMDTLVLSPFYALPVWGSSLGTAAVSRLQRLCNRAVRVTCGLRKYDHVSAAHHNLGWLPFNLLVQYRTLVLMHRHYVHDNCVQLDPPLLFSPNHGHNTRQSSHFCSIFCYSIAFGQRFFRSKATMWWNGLPHSLFDCDFHKLFLIIYLTCIVSKYIMYIYVSVYLYFCVCMLYINIVVLYSCVWLYYSYSCVVFCDWQGRTAVADCQINNQSINQSIIGSHSRSGFFI